MITFTPYNVGPRQFQKNLLNSIAVHELNPIASEMKKVNQNVRSCKCVRIDYCMNLHEGFVDDDHV